MVKADMLVVGVGGQGVLLASNLLAEVGLRAGYDVKKAEVHGMSQRGGSVNSHVRWGVNVKSPVIGDGDVDYLLALEKLEALRYLTMLRTDGCVLIGDYMIFPLSVSSGNEKYPSDEEILWVTRQMTNDYLSVPTLTLAEEAGNVRAHNVVLLGAFSAKIPHIPLETWLAVIESHFPKKHIVVNNKAFLKGRNFVLQKTN